MFFTNSTLLNKYLHAYQLKSYNATRYFKYFKNKKSYFLALCIVFYILVLLIKPIRLYLLIYVVFYALNLFYIKNFIKSKKTPLKFTKKLIRIEILSILILSILSFYKFAFLIIIAISPIVPIIALACSHLHSTAIAGNASRSCRYIK